MKLVNRTGYDTEQLHQAVSYTKRRLLGVWGIWQLPLDVTITFVYSSGRWTAASVTHPGDLSFRVGLAPPMAQDEFVVRRLLGRDVYNRFPRMDKVVMEIANAWKQCCVRHNPAHKERFEPVCEADFGKQFLRYERTLQSG